MRSLVMRPSRIAPGLLAKLLPDHSSPPPTEPNLLCRLFHRLLRRHHHSPMCPPHYTFPVPQPCAAELGPNRCAVAMAGDAPAVEQLSMGFFELGLRIRRHYSFLFGIWHKRMQAYWAGLRTFRLLPPSSPGETGALAGHHSPPPRIDSVCPSLVARGWEWGMDEVGTWREDMAGEPSVEVAALRDGVAWRREARRRKRVAKEEFGLEAGGDAQRLSPTIGSLVAAARSCGSLELAPTALRGLTLTSPLSFCASQYPIRLISVPLGFYNVPRLFSVRFPKKNTTSVLETRSEPLQSTNTIYYQNKSQSHSSILLYTSYSIWDISLLATLDQGDGHAVHNTAIGLARSRVLGCNSSRSKTRLFGSWQRCSVSAG